MCALVQLVLNRYNLNLTLTDCSPAFIWHQQETWLFLQKSFDQYVRSCRPRLIKVTRLVENPVKKPLTRAGPRSRIAHMSKVNSRENRWNSLDRGWCHM